MPTTREHRAAAARHLKAYRATHARFPEWGAVMLFYAALHLLEQVFARESRHCITHSDRELHIKSHHKSVWPAYHRLQSESMKARYLQGGGFSLPARAVDCELRRGKLAELRRYARSTTSLFDQDNSGKR